MGGGSTSTTNSAQEQVSQTQLPPWINQAAAQNYAFAQNVATQPLQQYQGQLVANPGPQSQQAWNLAATSGTAGAPQYQESEAGFLSSLMQNAGQIATPGAVAPNTISPQTLAGTNLSPYMNPYTSSVINATLPLMQQQAGAQQSALAGNAAQQGAWGGSRAGVASGVLGAQNVLNQAQMAASLNQANFGQAQGAAQQDIANNLAAQQANANLGLQGQQFNVNALLQQQQGNINANLQQENIGNVAAAGLGVLGQQAQTNQARQFSELTTAGALEQQQAQNEINANLAQFQQAWNYPGQQLGVLQSALGMTPYGQTTESAGTSQSTTSAPSDLAMTALGGLQTLGSLFGGGGPFGASGAFSGLFGSDRGLKTDITRVDTHPTGLPIYAYRYKGDPKSYPKVVGPMAEDVMKIAPHAVRPLGVGGRLGVHMPTLDALAAFATPPSPPSIMGAARGTAGIMPSSVNPPGLPPSPRQAGGMPQGTPSGGGMGGAPLNAGLPVPQGGGPLPGALSAPVPMGAVGALGSTLRQPSIRPRMKAAFRGQGALGLGG
jgi:hypothetical protein